MYRVDVTVSATASACRDEQERGGGRQGTLVVGAPDLYWLDMLSSTAIRPAVEPAVVPRRCTLDGFADEAARLDGIALKQLEPITRLTIRTRNSTYQITVLQPSTASVLVQGGRFFPDPTAACLNGSGFGGSCLKLAWVGVGMRMEFHSPNGRIITSRVQSISVDSAESAPGPF